MPYSKELDTRIAQVIAGWESTDRKNMFGGVCYLLRGNMVGGVYRDSLILRLGADGAAHALDQPFVRPFDITGRPMKGWVMVEAEGFQGRDLDLWLDKAKAFVETLPPK